MPINKLSRFMLAFTLTIMLFVFTPHAYAQSDPRVSESSVEYRYGEQIIFSAQVYSEAPVEDALISIRVRGESDTMIDRATVTSSGELAYVYEIPPRPLRAFTVVDYWFKVSLENGLVFSSPTFSFEYNDNRYDWQKLESGPFLVHWYDGDVEFAQTVLDVADEGLKRAQALLPLQELSRISIYVYASAIQMPETPGKEWVAGQAYPDLGVIVASLPPGPEQRLEIERQIPHELMHILLYQATGNGYENLPAWLNEGLATMAELYPTPEYQVLLENAVKNEALIPIIQLCHNFPVYASSAWLSYAESSYFTRYIYRQYGSSGLSSLVANYANGLDCERGVEVALGTSLSRLEEQWLKETLGANVAGEGIDKLLPWFILLFIVLAIPLVLATAGMITGNRKPTSTVRNTGVIGERS